MLGLQQPDVSDLVRGKLARFSRQRLEAAEPIPAWLDPLRERAAAWIGATASDFTHALVAEYRPGTPLGWHRDVPDFEDIVGVSLLGAFLPADRKYYKVLEKFDALDLRGVGEFLEGVTAVDDHTGLTLPGISTHTVKLLVWLSIASWA